jgi:TatD DNase family protein
VLVDSHCHLDRLKMDDEQLSEALDFAYKRGIEHFLCVAVSVREFPDMLKRVEHYSRVLWSAPTASGRCL